MMPSRCAAARASAIAIAIVRELRDGDRTSAESLLERFSVEILHHDDIVAFQGRDVVNGADVRVVQRRNGARLMLKTGPHLWVGVDATGRDLDGDRSTQTAIARAVHLAHATSTCELEDFVGTESSAGFERHVQNVFELPCWR